MPASPPAARMLGIAGALLLALAGSSAAAGELETLDARIAEGRALSAQLGGELKQALMTAISEGGPLGAIDVCRIEAPKIAERLGTQTLHVGRTALRVRNPANTADAAQRAVLQDFERRLSAGEPANALEDLSEDDRSNTTRYMKAIVTQPMCQICHGPAIDKDLASAIAERYPDDRATGFEAGSLRGAFVVEWNGMPD